MTRKTTMVIHAILDAGYKPEAHMPQGAKRKCLALTLRPGDDASRLPMTGAAIERRGRDTFIYWPDTITPEDLMSPADPE